jgi:hypothetical protein
MSDKDSNFDLNDELLSAYIDGELSADERAAVEARLESDPAARQLLHQLRSVSESVQALPQEKLQRDLSDAVLGRVRSMRGSATAAADTSPNTDAPSGLGNTLSKVPLFHSTRAWIWASLALAAGLLVMVVQSGDDPSKKLPPIAQRGEPNVANQPADESLDGVRRELTRAPEPQAPSIVAAAPMPAAQPSELSQIAAAAKPTGPTGAASSPAMKDDLKEADSLAAHDRPASTDGTPSNTLAKSPQSGGQGFGGGGPQGSIRPEDRAKPAPDDRKFLIVHVVATPEAFKNKSFDQLIQAHGIKFEPQPEKATSLSASAGERYARQPKNESSVEQRDSKVAEAPAQDLVLVEGPKLRVESLLAALNKNTTDYLGVDVDGQSRGPKGAAPSRLGGDKTISEDFSIYNRGTDPRGIDARVSGARGGNAANADFDSYFDMLNESTDGGSKNDASYGVQINAGAEQSPRERFDQAGLKPQSNEGRAIRVDWYDAKDRQLTEEKSRDRAFRSADQPAQKPQPLKKMMEKAAKRATTSDAKTATPSDTVKVLFVLTPNNAAPSTPAATPPK